MPIYLSAIREEVKSHTLLANSVIEAVLVRLDAPPAAVDALASALGAAERHRAARFRFERDRMRFVVAHSCLRQLLAERLHTDAASIEFSYGIRGKPALAEPLDESGWQFNLSYSGDMAAVALARGCRVGIDIEAIRAVPEAEPIATRFFSPRENAAWRSLAPQDRSIGFVNCWTRKEALLKAIGEGLYCPGDRFEVSLAPSEPARLIDAGDVAALRAGWRLHSLTPPTGFVAALASDCAASSSH